MCGICGIFRPDARSVDPGRVLAMRESMSYRGPNAAGLTSGDGYALGHRRLSIIDLSENGAQPMGNEDGSVEVVFNGTIYNFLELRHELTNKGHTFRSRTDTEVLVHGYEQWGIEELLRRVRGMYAFCILDHRWHQVHLARDPVGVKPLFFSIVNDELVFASSIGALLKALPNIPEIDPGAVDQLLCNLYICGPRTLFNGIEKLPAGHALTLNKNGERKDIRHWYPNFLGNKEKLAPQEWVERIREALRTAVRRRLVADVPIGVLLSGGVDSSLITAIAAELKQVRTFSVVNSDPALDERRYSRAVAEMWGTDHQELEVSGNLRDSLTAIVGAMGEPLADASAVNVYALAEKARQFVTVVLTGDGGDEAFGGYTHFLSYYEAERLRRFCVPRLWPLFDRAGELLWKTNGLGHRAGTLLRLMALPVENTLFAFDSAMAPEIRSQLYTNDLRRQWGCRPHNQHLVDVLSQNSHDGWDVDRVMQVQMLTTLPDDYLAKMDGSTMAVSLEARSPFLDLDVLELAMTVPAPMRFRGGKTKSLLRSLGLKYVPRQCVKRRKQGFSAPIGSWLREDLRNLLAEFVLGPHVEKRNWFRREVLQRVVEENTKYGNHSDLIWGLVVLELWMRICVERTISPGTAL